MMKFFTADTHFHHHGAITNCNRPFSSVEEMDEQLIANWNEVVGPKDEVYHLGDIALCGSQRLAETLSALNGRIYLIRGNHDEHVLKPTIIKRFEWVKDYFILRENKQKIILFHYPIDSWDGKPRDVWHLHGHSHGENENIHPHKLDVGVDVHSFAPISMEDLNLIMYERNCPDTDL